MQGRNSRTGFEKAAKRRQQEFREVSPTVSDRGRSPTDDKGLRYPYLLAIDLRNRQPLSRHQGSERSHRLLQPTPDDVVV